MPLGNIAKGYHKHRGNHKRRCGIPVEGFYEQLEEKIVKPNTDHRHNKITKKLDAPPQWWLGEHHEHAQIKPDGKCKTEWHDIGRDMRAYNTYWSSYILLEENIVVSDKINKYIQY